MKEKDLNDSNVIKLIQKTSNKENQFHNIKLLLQRDDLVEQNKLKLMYLYLYLPAQMK